MARMLVCARINRKGFDVTENVKVTSRMSRKGSMKKSERLKSGFERKEGSDPEESLDMVKAVIRAEGTKAWAISLWYICKSKNIRRCTQLESECVDAAPGCRREKPTERST